MWSTEGSPARLKVGAEDPGKAHRWQARRLGHGWCEEETARDAGVGGWAAGQLVGGEEVGWQGETKEEQGEVGGAGDHKGWPG